MSDIFRDYSFGGWIRHFRIEQGLTLRKFAELSSYDVGYLSRLENSELPLSQDRQEITLRKTKKVKLNTSPMLAMKFGITEVMVQSSYLKRCSTQ